MCWKRARTEQQKTQRRQEILDAAYRLFETKEYSEISLNAIAREAGITKPNIYRYFTSREEIFLAIYTDAFVAWASELNDTIGRLRKGNAERVAEVWAEVTCNHPKLARLAPMVAVSMERNSSVEQVVEHKRTVLQLSMPMQQQLKRLFPTITDEGCMDVMLCVYCLVAGLGPAAMNRPPVLEEVLKMPEFAVFNLNMKKMIKRIVRTIIEANTERS